MLMEVTSVRFWWHEGQMHPPQADLQEKATIPQPRDVTAVGAADAGEALARIAAVEIVVDGPPHDRPPKPVLALKPVGIDPLELVEVLLDQAMQGRLPWFARAVERGILTGR